MRGDILSHASAHSWLQVFGAPLSVADGFPMQELEKSLRQQEVAMEYVKEQAEKVMEPPLQKRRQAWTQETCMFPLRCTCCQIATLTNQLQIAEQSLSDSKSSEVSARVALQVCHTLCACPHCWSARRKGAVRALRSRWRPRYLRCARCRRSLNNRCQRRG